MRRLVTFWVGTGAIVVAGLLGAAWILNFHPSLDSRLARLFPLVAFGLGLGGVALLAWRPSDWGRHLDTALTAIAWVLTSALASGTLGTFHPAFDLLAHFRLHLLGLFVPVMIVLLLRRHGTEAFFLLITGIITLGTTDPFLPGIAPERKATVRTGDTLRIVQLNMRFNNRDTDLIVRRLTETDADVFLLQEVSRTTSRAIERLDGWPHRHVCMFRDFRGVAVVSRVPFVETIPCAEDGGVAAVTLDRPKPVTVVSLHAYWPWPSRQWQQLERIRPLLNGLPEPLIVAGDFNATPWSAFVKAVARETRTRPAAGLRFTFNAMRLQSGDTRFGGLPIDHVLTSPNVAIRSLRLMPHAGSDHLGTVAEVAW